MAAQKYQILGETICEVGSGQNVSWYDRWIDGHSTSQIAPDLVQFIEPSMALQKTAADALTVRNWIRGISGTLTIPSIVQFIELWLCTQAALPPLSEEQDKFTSWLTANGKYTAKSAYKDYFWGAVEADPTLLWNCWALFRRENFPLACALESMLNWRSTSSAWPALDDLFVCCAISAWNPSTTS